MKQIQNFRFNDLVLYSKGWYETFSERTGIINNEDGFFEDLEKAIKMNHNYWYPDHMTKDEVIEYLLKALDIIYTYLDENDKKCGRWYYTHSAFRNEVKHRMWLYDCSEEYAIALLVHGVLQGLTKDEIKLNKPIYKKGNWRLGSQNEKMPAYSMTYKYMNSRASQMFDK